MEFVSSVEFYIAIAAVTASLLASVSGLPPGDNVLVEVKLEKELQLVSRNFTPVNENETEVHSFECVITGLNEEELTLFSSGKNNNVIVSAYKSGNLSSDDFLNKEGTESEPFNVKITVENGTLLVRGDVLMIKTSKIDTTTDVNRGAVDSITNCDLVFLDAEEDTGSHESNENVTNRSSRGISPKIVTRYDNIVLMNGAPEQVISCTARGNPSPQMRWTREGRSLNTSNTAVLSRDNLDTSGETVSYLLFSQVDHRVKGNYTCSAENSHGKSTKTFEVEVISVEAITRCNDVSDNESSAPPRNREIIFKQNIHELLRRSKRNVWYQWRTTRIDDDTFFNRPYNPFPSHPHHHNDHNHNTDLQRMVNLIAERLKLADKVAVNKWDNNLPVEDIPREQIILENMVRQAESRGLQPDWAHRFFRDQIEANKDVQHELLQTWERHGRRPHGPPVDLANEVRPEIDYINGRLIELAKYTENERRGWRCREEVEKNSRYASFLYNLAPLHQPALQRATANICIQDYFSRGPRYPVHHYPPAFPPFYE